MFVLLNHTNPIAATEIAVRAAIGLMVCNFELVVVMNAVKVNRETKINVALIAEFLLLIFWWLQYVISMLWF